MAEWRQLDRGALKGVTNKDLKKLLQEAANAGATYRETGSKHLMIRLNGEMITVASSPSDHRSVKDAQNRLRKALSQ